MAKYILNGWGWGMPQPKKGDIHYEDLTEEQFQEEIIGAISCVGNPALARILKIPYSPSYISLREDDVALVIHITGGKLPYGAKELPSDISLNYTKVELKEAASI